VLQIGLLRPRKVLYWQFLMEGGPGASFQRALGWRRKPPADWSVGMKPQRWVIFTVFQ